MYFVMQTCDTSEKFLLFSDSFKSNAYMKIWHKSVINLWLSEMNEAERGVL